MSKSTQPRPLDIVVILCDSPRQGWTRARVDIQETLMFNTTKGEIVTANNRYILVWNVDQLQGLDCYDILDYRTDFLMEVAKTRMKPKNDHNT